MENSSLPCQWIWLVLGQGSNNSCVAIGGFREPSKQVKYVQFLVSVQDWHFLFTTGVINLTIDDISDRSVCILRDAPSTFDLPHISKTSWGCAESWFLSAIPINWFQDRSSWKCLFSADFADSIMTVYLSWSESRADKIANHCYICFQS